MEFSVSSYLFSDEKLDLKHLQMIQQAGYQGMDIFAIRSHFDWHDQALVTEVNSWLQKSSLKCTSMHAPYDPDGRIDIASLDEIVRLDSIAGVCMCIDALKAFGGKHFVVHPGTDLSVNADTEAKLEKSIQSLQAIADYAAGKEIMLVLENPPPGELAFSEKDFMAVYRQITASHQIGFCLDTGHANILSNGLYVFSKHELRPSLVHISDNYGSADQHLPPGQGNINWKNFFSSLKQLGYDETVILEIGRCSDPFSILKQMHVWFAARTKP